MKVCDLHWRTLRNLWSSENTPRVFHSCLILFEGYKYHEIADD